MDSFFLTISGFQRDLGPGSEIHDFQFVDPDPKLMMLDPEHWICYTKTPQRKDKIGGQYNIISYLLWYYKSFPRMTDGAWRGFELTECPNEDKIRVSTTELRYEGL